jgi:hypothetical protein
MRKCVLFVVLLAACNAGFAQITVGNADMPAAGDNIVTSNASIVSLSAYTALNDTGSSHAWNFSNLTLTSQSTQSFQSAAAISFIYGFALPSSAFGYKVADSLPLLGNFLPVSVQSIYSFYNLASNPDELETIALGISVDSFPLPVSYTDPDVVYALPLAYGDTFSAPYLLTISIPNTFTVQEKGTRTTKVDGWGTVVTPYLSTPTNCVRLRSEKDEEDSLSIDSLNFSVPVTTVEYKWLAKGYHAPVLQINANKIAGVEVVTSIAYLDTLRDLSVANAAPAVNKLSAYPNPATEGYVTISVPDSWANATVQLFDMQGKEVALFTHTQNLDIAGLAKGNYLARVVSGTNVGYVRITR